MDYQELENTLIERVLAHDKDADIAKIRKAIEYAKKYHAHQTRESGEPYYTHPVEVAIIIADMKLDVDSVITAILHDTVEDTELTLDELKKEFGESIAGLVDGVTKLTQIEFQTDNVKQAENFRKLLLAMSNDIRVLLVKLADRVHNMRTIDGVKSQDKKMRKALETMEIYAPLAERIGVQQLKLELHDISFKILHPDIRESIINRLSKLAADGKELVNRVISEITKVVKKQNINAEVYGRQKTPYSIWQKMKMKNVSFEQLSDIIAFRVIVDSKEECYKALGTIHSEYHMVPESFQDFISTPKSNGYQSIHTVVIGPEKQVIEIQIRTKDMHEVAELGVAAHWGYKQNYQAKDGKQYRWIRELLNILDQADDSEEFLANTKLAMYYDQVFCFTPRGALIALPKGATPVDFAYAVHSDIGHKCVGSKVNGRIVPLRTILHNGDQVDIITAKNQTPSPSWEKFVVTGKARAEVRKFIRSQQRQEYISLGKAILDKAFKDEQIQDAEKELSSKLPQLKKQKIEDVYFAVGEGVLTRETVLNILKPKETNNSKLSPLSFFKFKKKKDDNKKSGIPIKGLIPGMAVHFAGCCHPIPGDKIVGIIHTGKGVTIHTSDCEMLANFTSTPERLIDLTWDADGKSTPFIGRLKATLLNEPGSLALITSEIAKDKGNITNFRITTRNKDFFEVIIDLEVAGTQHLNNIIMSLRSQGPIHSVERYKL